MELSQETRNIIIDINGFSNNKLKNINDVSLLLEASLKNDANRKLFKDLIFIAKYLNGLGKIMMNSISGNAGASVKEEDKPVIESSAEIIRGEYKKNIEQFVNALNQLLSQAGKDNNIAFKDRYLNMTKTSLLNLTSLIYDLSWVKKYYNEKGL
jgi:hypothetical protein